MSRWTQFFWCPSHLLHPYPEKLSPELLAEARRGRYPLSFQPSRPLDTTVQAAPEAVLAGLGLTFLVIWYHKGLGSPGVWALFSLGHPANWLISPGIRAWVPVGLRPGLLGRESLRGALRGVLSLAVHSLFPPSPSVDRAELSHASSTPSG